MTDPVVLLHGFTQTASSFDPLRQALALRGIDAEALELPGHEIGQGPDRLVVGSLGDGADDIVRRMSPPTPRAILGYSMGARVALQIAITHPEALRSVVLISGTAGIDDPDGRAARRAADEKLATRIEQIGSDAFLSEWLAQPMFDGLAVDVDMIAARATNTARGLASSLRCWGTGTMDPPLWDRLAEIEVPTLVIAGARDTKFVGLGRRLAAGIGSNARFVAVPGAGHATHLEAPDVIAGLVADHLGI
ncbi:MAG: alpha/beta fold hydrolase [Actinobacteria bacterium]|nr:alpha/beta fold hydrolase [Actinomycetota bacterium]